MAGLLIVSAACGCWVKEEVGKKMQADIAATQVEMEVVKKANAEEKANLQKRIAEADQKIAELTKVIEEYRRATGRNAADFGVDIEKLKTQIMEIRGQLEVSEHRLGLLEGRITGKVSKQSEPPVPVKTEVDATKPVIESKPTDPLPAINRPAKQEDFYKLAYGLLESGQAQASRVLFSEFLAKWPSGDYADNATYWIGESYYSENNFRDAALTFDKVRKQFPKGDKAPDALLKLGYCFFGMEKYKESLAFLQEFVQSYPRNKMVTEAKKKIQEAKKKAGK